MAIVKWDPFRNINTLQDRINRLFDDAFPHKLDDDDDMVCAWRPMVDIYETDAGIVIQVDLPGVDKSNVAVEVKENVLTIQGERMVDKTASEENYYRRERTCGTFQRSFTLRHHVAPDSVKASFKNGVLKIEIPKPEEDLPKRITVDID